MMKLTATGKPFGERKSKAEVLESIRESMVSIGKICNQDEEYVNRLMDVVIRIAEENE